MAQEPQKQDENRAYGKAATQFKPGQSGNPGGRPKGSGNTTNKLIALLSDDKNAQALAVALFRLAKKGNPVAIKAVLDRADGPVTQKIQIEDLSNEQLLGLLEEDGSVKDED